MTGTQLVSKEHFVDGVRDRLTGRYTARVHGVGVIFAICVSFYFTFLKNELRSDIGLGLLNVWDSQVAELLFKEAINLGTFAGAFAIYKFLSKGLSISSTPFFVSYRYGPADFLKWMYWLASAIALLISVAGVNYAKSGRVGPLMPLEAFYYVVGVISTTGSDITPASRVAEVLMVILSAVTLLLAVFVFQKIPDIRVNKKVYFGGGRFLENAYDEITSALDESALTEVQKGKVFKFFLEEFNFDTEDGLAPLMSRMRRGKFDFIKNL